MARPKKNANNNILTLDALNQENNQLNETKTIPILNGKFMIQLDKHFRRSKIQKLIVNYLELLQNLKQRENVDTDTIIGAVSLINILIVKYFSTLPIQDLKTIDDLVQMSEKLLDLGIMDQLFSDNPDIAFDKSEIQLLEEQINKASKRQGELLGELALASTLNEGENGADIQQSE